MSVSFLGPEPARPTRSRRFSAALTWALAVAVAALAIAAVWAPIANAQEAPPAPPADTPADPTPPPPDPAPAPEPVPNPPASEAPPPDPNPAPPPDPAPPADPAPQDPAPPITGAGDQQTPSEGSSTTRDETVAERTDPAPQRETTITAIEGATDSTAPLVAAPAISDLLGPVAQMPADAGAESWIWTAEGDAFINGFGVAGSGTPGGPSGGLGAVLLNSPAGAAVRLEAAQRKRNEAAEASAIGSSAPPGAPGSGSNSFFNLFNGGGGGGGAVLLWFLLAIIAVWRLVPPDLTKTFLSPMATWRPSAYIPPIQHPG